jgi:hypothetical protein
MARVRPECRRADNQSKTLGYVISPRVLHLRIFDGGILDPAQKPS